MSTRYGQYFEDSASCNTPKTTRHRLRQRQNYSSSDDSERDTNWQGCSSNPTLSKVSTSSSTNERMTTEGNISESEATNLELSLQSTNNECLQSPLLSEEMSETSIDEQEISANSFANAEAIEQLFGFSESEDENIQDGWIRDVVEDLFQSSEEDIDDNEYVLPDEEHNINDGNSRFSKLKKCLEKDETNNIIDTPLVVSKAEVLLSILKFALSYSLPQTAIADLFKMMNSFLGKKVFPDTRYLIDQFFNTEDNTEFHAVCPNGNNYIKKFEKHERNLICDLCNSNISLKDPTYTNFFATINVEHKIVNLIEQNSSYYENIMTSSEEDGGYYSDITDGVKYKEFRKSLPENTKRNFATATFNSDGSPLFESSTFSIWPVQLVINELPYHVRTSKPIVCAIWFGKSKPHMNTFLSPFVNYMNALANEGVRCNINNELRIIKVFPICCCADSVARAPMQGLVQFNGYCGCNWCLHPGFYVQTERGGAIKYILTEEEYGNRTETQTLEYMQRSITSNVPVFRVKHPTILINLPNFEIISGFVPDSMHCINLGVADQFLDYWLKSTMTPYSLKSEMDNIDGMLQIIKVPNHVMRLSRSIKDRRWWKAKEWENWVLFYSLPILLHYPELKLYAEHWASSVEAYYLLLQDNISHADIIRAHSLFKVFVGYTEVYYSQHAMTYNVHQLLHVTQSVINWGPLWSHSGYCFESGNGQLVKTVKAAKGVINQICISVAMNECESILKARVSRREYSTVSDFVSYLDKKCAKNTLKLLTVRYFGPNHKVNSRWTEELQLSNESRSYKKIVKDGCLYNSCKKSRFRSDNSFAITKNKMCIRIIAFLVDRVTYKEYTIVNEVETQSIADNDFIAIRKITNISDISFPIETSDIDKVCVHINVDENSYVTAVPNLKYY